MKKKEIGEVYGFARFNRKANIVTYTDEQYNKVIAPLKSDWSKLETDVLFDLCERFSLRFIVIADRFAYELQEKVAALNEEESKDMNAQKKKRVIKKDRKMMAKTFRKDRSVDEVKQRYYEVAKAILTLQGNVNHLIVQKPFNFEQEVRRKNNLEKLFMRTKDQMEREKLMQIELKKLEQKIKKEEKEEKNLAKLIDNDLEEAKF
jgi:DNA methyltransferase 1-associated protein 1